MDNDSLLAKCPHCHTLFSIKPEHLAVADGAVRCGVCYQVFNATPQLRAPGESHTESRTESRTESHTKSPHQPGPADTSVSQQSVEHSDDAPIANTRVNDSGATPETEQPNPNITDALPPGIVELQNLVLAEQSIDTLLAPPPPSSRRLLLWSTLSLLAVSLLLTQWLWFNAPHYAKQPQWRAWYEKICPHLGCTLPPFQDIKQLKTERLAITSHPQYDNALVIELIIHNQASRAQPLPLLSMEFFSSTGEPLARRLFQPEEYLRQQVPRLAEIPAQTPVHLSFAILDPGPAAVNYSVNLLLAH